MSNKRTFHNRVRAWSTERLIDVLKQNGLQDCCNAVQKRCVDGELFLTLTEGQLALWKRDLTLANIKKLSRFVQDVIDNPEKFLQQDAPSMTFPLTNNNHSGKSSPLSDSWDTDFSDDGDASKAWNTRQQLDADQEVEYCNEEVLLDKPAVPARPPALAPKPTALPTPGILPKPPVPPQNNSYGHVKFLVSNLNLPETSDQFDDEYESVNGSEDTSKQDSLAALLKKSLEIRTQTHIQQGSGIEEETLSDEYESIKENVNVVDAVTNQPGIEYYLQPVQQSDQISEVPPVPAKPWTKIPDMSVSPHLKAPSPPPRNRSDDSSSSPGNSGDGVTGLIGEIFRKIRSPSSLVDVGEKNSTPEVKKSTILPTSVHKPLSVDHRSGSLQGNQRPLPPTPEDKKTAEKNNILRVSKVGLTQQPWYHNIDRKRAEELLRNGEDGSFVVRPSSQPQNPLTLTLWYNKRLYNIGIRHRRDGRYALGTEKTNEQSFDSVEDLVQNYKSEKLLLYSCGERTGRTLLTSSLPQS